MEKSSETRSVTIPLPLWEGRGVGLFLTIPLFLLLNLAVGSVSISSRTIFFSNDSKRMEILPGSFAGVVGQALFLLGEGVDETEGRGRRNAGVVFRGAGFVHGLSDEFRIFAFPPDPIEEETSEPPNAERYPHADAADDEHLVEDVARAFVHVEVFDPGRVHDGRLVVGLLSRGCGGGGAECRFLRGFP